jgi:hypothetical protein
VLARRGVANRVCNGNAPDCRNRVRIPRTYHGGLTPPALVLRCGRPPAKKRLLRCTNAHPARSGGRQPAVDVGNTFADTGALVRRTGDGACADRHCIRIQRCREGPTLVPAPAFRGPQWLHTRRGLPRGADAPRSCIGMRTSAGEKTTFAMHKRTPKRAAGVSPPWVSVTPVQ